MDLQELELKYGAVEIFIGPQSTSIAPVKTKGATGDGFSEIELEAAKTIREVDSYIDEAIKKLDRFITFVKKAREYEHQHYFDKDGKCKIPGCNKILQNYD